jgi:glyoxylase-like metal-dependent hydrolase (beta-lactamase superfamily II)
VLHCLSIPTPFPVGPVNVYLSESGPLTLIDTGPKWDDSRAALEAGLMQRGQRVEDIRQLILTHHHVDHVGLAAEIARRSGCAVLTHPRNTPWLVNYAAERARHLPFFHRIWEESGVPADIIAQMEASGASMPKWADPVTPTREIGEGDTVTISGAAWRVYHTPGHAGGLICLWEPGARTLLANDHFIRDISSNPILEPPSTMNGPRPKRLVEYLHHMRRMADLNPARALPGHGEVVEDVAGLVRHRLAFHARRKERILKMLDGHPQTLWELTEASFGSRLTRGIDWFLGCSEILGHLDLLEEDGAVTPVPQGEVVKWTKVMLPEPRPAAG